MILKGRKIFLTTVTPHLHLAAVLGVRQSSEGGIACKSYKLWVILKGSVTQLLRPLLLVRAHPGVRDEKSNVVGRLQEDMHEGEHDGLV